MNEQQSILLSMYKDAKEILDRHNIRYYGVFGTAIGALRHNGVIPWDDDIDLAVYRKDLPTIEKLFKEELDSSKYYYHVPSADTHPHLVYKGEDFETSLKSKSAPFIDLFIIERYPSTIFRRFFAWGFIWADLVWISILNHVNSARAHNILYKIPAFFEKCALHIVNKNSKRTTMFCTAFKICNIDIDSYGEPRSHAFEDTVIPLPEKIEEILEFQYGDYMTPPPEDKRCGAIGFPCSIYKDYVRDLRKSGE